MPVQFAPLPNNHAHVYSDMKPDNELKENIKHRLQEVFSSMLESARQKGVSSYEHEPKFLGWLHEVVEKTYRAESAREHQPGQHKKDNYRTALLKEKQELTDRLQHIDNVIYGLVAAFPDDLVPSGPISAPTHKPKPAPKSSSNKHTSRNVQWEENERRRVRESSNFRAIGEAIRQIESNRQRQWSNWTDGKTRPPLPIIREQEDILNRITRAAVSPPLHNNSSAPSASVPYSKSQVSVASSGHQQHGKGMGGKYHPDSQHAHNAGRPTVWPPAPPMKSTEYSTFCLRCKPHKSRNERTANPGYEAYGNTVAKPSYEFWYPPNMKEAGTAPEAGRGYMYSRPGNAEAKERGKVSFR
jgi:hypothetical protein